MRSATVKQSDCVTTAASTPKCCALLFSETPFSVVIPRNISSRRQAAPQHAVAAAQHHRQRRHSRGEARRGEARRGCHRRGAFNYRTTQQTSISTYLTLCESYVIRGISVCLHAFTRQSGGRSSRIFNRRRVSCSCHLPPSAVGGSHRLYSSRVASPRRKPHVSCGYFSRRNTPHGVCHLLVPSPKCFAFPAQSLVALARAPHGARPPRYSFLLL